MQSVAGLRSCRPPTTSIIANGLLQIVSEVRDQLQQVLIHRPIDRVSENCPSSQHLVVADPRPQERDNFSSASPRRLLWLRHPLDTNFITPSNRPSSLPSSSTPLRSSPSSPRSSIQVEPFAFGVRKLGIMLSLLRANLAVASRQFDRSRHDPSPLSYSPSRFGAA